MKLEGKIALVTGGGSGIGRAVSTLFAREGATVAVNDINEDTAQKTVADLGSGIAVPADVADSAQVGAMFGEVDRQLGTLDILVNCAGIAEVTPSDAAEMEQLVNAAEQQGFWKLIGRLFPTNEAAQFAGQPGGVRRSLSIRLSKDSDRKLSKWSMGARVQHSLRGSTGTDNPDSKKKKLTHEKIR